MGGTSGFLVLKIGAPERIHSSVESRCSRSRLSSGSIAAIISAILSRIGFTPPPISLTSSDAENKNCERYNQPGRSEPMVLIPAMLLRLPVFRKGFRRPFYNPVVDGHRTDERKHDGEDLDCE